MKTSLALAVACFSLQCVPAAQAHPRQVPPSDSRHLDQFETRQHAEIRNVLKSYEQSLNDGDVRGVIQLYTDDAVLLAPDAPSSVGIDAVRAAYTATFQAIRLNITFDIAELKLLSPEWALLRTNSTGIIKIVANDAQIPEGNQELFLLHKSYGRWKIARYSFSSFLRSTK